MIIDCDSCTARDWHCAECVVSHLLGPPGRIDLDDDACQALDVLADSGLVPPLRMVPVIGKVAPAPGARPGGSPAEDDRLWTG